MCDVSEQTSNLSDVSEGLFPGYGDMDGSDGTYQGAPGGCTLDDLLLCVRQTIGHRTAGLLLETQVIGMSVRLGCTPMFSIEAGKGSAVRPMR